MTAIRHALVGLIALSTIGCTAATDKPGEAVLGVTETADAEGRPISVEVLEGSTMLDEGAVFDVRVDDVRYVVHADLSESPAVYWTADEHGELLVAAVVDEDLVEVSSVDGFTARSESGGVCDDQLEGIDGVPYRLLEAEVLAAMQQIVNDTRAPHAGDEVGGARAALGFSIGGVYGADQCPGVSCSARDGSEKCCCGVNRKCKIYDTACYCVDASYPSFSGTFIY